MMKTIILLFVLFTLLFVKTYSSLVTSKSISVNSQEYENKFNIKLKKEEKKYENHEESLNLDGMNLRSIKNDLIRSNTISHISLANNFLKKIPHNVLDYVPYLSYLNLSHNNINLFEANKILHPNLRMLDLSQMSIDDINAISEVEDFSDTEDIDKYKYMIFNSTKIRLPNLEYLDLSMNDISALLWDFNLSFPKLIRLDLININAVELEPHFFDKISTSLRILHLENNHFRNLTLRNTGEITFLYLDGNTFETIDITSMKLKTLSLSNCTQHLSTAYLAIPNLEELDFSRNNLDVFDIHLERIQSLKVLLLDYNKLSYVPPLNNLQWLNELSLRYNVIKFIKRDAFNYLTSLTKLSLKGNLIERIEKENFLGLEKLEYLDLSENQLSHLPIDWASSLIKLKYLNVNSNQFGSISEMGIYSINSLQHLCIKNNTFNKITTLEIEPLPHFITIYLH